MWVCLYVMIRDNLHKFPYTILSELDGWIEINLCRANCSSLSKFVDVFYAMLMPFFCSEEWSSSVFFERCLWPFEAQKGAFKSILRLVGQWVALICAPSSITIEVI